jgi:hypothetical protein
MALNGILSVWDNDAEWLSEFYSKIVLDRNALPIAFWKKMSFTKCEGAGSIFVSSKSAVWKRESEEYKEQVTTLIASV